MNPNTSAPVPSPLPFTPPGNPQWRPSWAAMGASRSEHPACVAASAQAWADRSLDVLDVDPLREAS